MADAATTQRSYQAQLQRSRRGTSETASPPENSATSVGGQLLAGRRASAEAARQAADIRSGENVKRAQQQAAVQARNLREGRGVAADTKLAAQQARDVRTGENVKRLQRGAARQNRQRFRRGSAKKAADQQAKSARQRSIAGQQKMVGRAWIKTLWAWIQPSFGHVIYLINITYFAGLMSKTARRWIPEVGEAWVPMLPASGAKQSAVAKGSRKAKIMILKVAELLAMAWFTFWVLAFDLLILVMIAFIVFAVEGIIDFFSI